MDIYAKILSDEKKIAFANTALEGVLSNISAGLWWRQNLKSSKDFSHASDKVIFLAFHSENFACAFNVAYQFALRHLFTQQIQDDEIACLCVSEQGGNSPALINTQLVKEQNNYFISGEKTFITCADQVDTLFILFDDKSQIKTDNAKTLRVLVISDVRKIIAQQQAGFTLTVAEKSMFVPEIQKGRLKLEHFEVNTSAMLPEEGHQYYSKSFSVLEGLFIRLANVSFLLKWSCYFCWPQSLKADLLAQITVLKQILDGNPLAPQAQILLDAQARMLEQNLTQIETLVLQTPAAFQAHWQRDKIVLFMDAPLRKQRLEKAWALFA